MQISTVEKTDLWLLIRKNQPDANGIAPLSAYQKRITPIIEVKFPTPTEIWEITEASNEQILTFVLNYYQNLIATKIYFPGPYGDWIKLTEWVANNQKYIKIDFIGYTAWTKPTLAADLGIFVHTSSRTFFVSIVRRNEPGKDLPAIVGGILNCGNRLDSAAYTVLKEAEEECNLRVKYQGDLSALQQDYNILEIPVSVENFAPLSPHLAQLSAKIHFVATVPTGEQERIADGTKRVYITSLFVIFIPLDNIDLNLDQLKTLFSSGDDASALYIVDVSSNFQKGIAPEKWYIPPFGLHHHPELFKLMMLTLQKQYPQFFR